MGGWFADISENLDVYIFKTEWLNSDLVLVFIVLGHKVLGNSVSVCMCINTSVQKQYILSNSNYSEV
jgi:hypothetical protein